MVKNYVRFLAAELLLIPLIVLIFKVIEPRLLAGAVAGTCFVLLGVWIFVTTLKSERMRWSATFFASSLHLFVSSLPLLITRLMNQNPQFSDMKVLGLAGPDFHRMSTGIFMILLVATVTDLVRAWFRQKGVKPAS